MVRAAPREPAAQLLRAHAGNVAVARLVAAVVVAAANSHVQVVIVAAAAAAAPPCLRPAALAPGVHCGAAKRSGGALEVPTLPLLTWRWGETRCAPPSVRCKTGVMGKRRASRRLGLFVAPALTAARPAAGGQVKQHGMDVDKPKAAAKDGDGWDYGGGGAAADDAMADGAGGQGACARRHCCGSRAQPAAHAVAPPHTAPSVSMGDGGAKMGLFGLVTGGCVPGG